MRPARAGSHSATGWPSSFDPEPMLELLLGGYLFGICSEPHLCEKVHLNLNVRCFCLLDLAIRVPDHSTSSKNRLNRYLHQLPFQKAVARCAAAGLVAGRQAGGRGARCRRTQAGRRSFRRDCDG